MKVKIGILTPAWWEDKKNVWVSIGTAEIPDKPTKEDLVRAWAAMDFVGDPEEYMEEFMENTTLIHETNGQWVCHMDTTEDDSFVVFSEVYESHEFDK